jgi:hypothetical protein
MEQEQQSIEEENNNIHEENPATEIAESPRRKRHLTKQTGLTKKRVHSTLLSTTKSLTDILS